MKRLPHLSAVLMILPMLVAGSLNAAATPAPTQVTYPVRLVGGTVQAAVPPGVGQVTLQGNQGNGWKPLAVSHLGTAWSRKSAGLPSFGVVGFPAPTGYTLAQLRVVAGAAKFPVGFFNGTSSFSQSGSSAVSPLVAAVGTTTVGTTSSPAITTSDVWKIIGARLFYFNQYRGLQVFDVSNSAAPVRTGTLSLPASGQQFYALDSTGANLAMLGLDQTPGAVAGSSAVFLVSVNAGKPALRTKLPIQGYVVDSRMIGSRLYVVSSLWGATAQTVVQGFDLTNPAQPVTQTPLAITGGYTYSVQAGDQTLLLTNSSWPTNTINVVDASGAAPVLAETLTTKGYVYNASCLNESGGIVTAVSALWSGVDGQETWIETFSATAGAAPLSQVEVVGASGQYLTAASFNGTNLYIVEQNWFQTPATAPLYVVDLSNPSTPVVGGSVNVSTGWQSFIQGSGNQVITVGVNNGQVQVSLFDVTNPAAPALLSQANVGPSTSWSLPSYDPTSVGFFPQQGLLLVPYQSLSTDGSNTWQNATALLSITGGTVTLQSSITDQFSAQRAAVVGHDFFSVSGQELIVEAVTNLAAPRLLADVSLSWPVDRVVPFGSSNLIQISNGDAGLNLFGPIPLLVVMRPLGWTPTNPSLRVSGTSDPDTLLDDVDMGPGQVIGTAQLANSLYVGQYVPASGSAAAKIRTWVFDVSNPPALPAPTWVDSPLPATTSQLNLSGAQALWPTNSTLAWFIPTQTWNFWGGPIVYASNLAVPVVGSANTSNGSGAPANSPAVVVPVSLANPQSPAAMSVIPITGSTANLSPGSGVAFASGGYLFAGYDEQVAVGPQSSTSSGGVYVVSYIFPFGLWNYTTRAWLQVLDFTQPGAPVVRDRTSIPGDLLNVTNVDDRGAILLTNVPSTSNSQFRSLQASVYDGVKAFQVNTWNSTLPAGGLSTASGNYLYLARGNSNPGVVSVGIDPTTGKIVSPGSVSLAQTPYQMAVINGCLLTSAYGTLDACVAGPSGALKHTAAFSIPTSIWSNVAMAGVVPNAGVWLPLGVYGTEYLPFSQLVPPALH